MLLVVIKRVAAIPGQAKVSSIFAGANHLTEKNLVSPQRASASPPRRKLFRAAAFFALCAAPLVFAGLKQGQDSDIPAEYVSAKLSDPISKVLARIGAGTLKLVYEPKRGYLKSILSELRVTPTSQILVFSKTSFQTTFISPRSPRAIYFNDDVYVGWIPGAPNIELVGIDPVVGPIFFTLRNEPSQAPTPVRQMLDCLQCHDSPMTSQVPGLMARSVFAGPDGLPRLAGGSFMTTATSPMKERWGGWYVTGRHGSQRHMGNEVSRGDEQAPVIDTEKGANVTDLRRYFDVDSYLTPHSDIVALMVAEQQMTIQNRITKAGYLTRKTLKDAADLLKYGFTPEHVAEETHDRIQNACEPIVQALLGTDEPELTAPIQGTSGFKSVFSVTAPPDKTGRRLSELDLKTRLLRYPCSPMIYSQTFTGLPLEARTLVLKRLNEILTGKDQTKPFVHLTAEDRKAVLEILRETLPEFALASNSA